MVHRIFIIVHSSQLYIIILGHVKTNVHIQRTIMGSIILEPQLCVMSYQPRYMYSRGQKKVNISFPCNEEFRFVSFSFRFRFVSVLSRRNFKIDRLRSHFPFCVFRFSVFPCLTKNATGERTDRWEPRERSIVKATRSPRLRFLAQKAFRVL